MKSQTDKCLPARAGRWLRRRALAARFVFKRLTGQPVRIHIENRWRLGDEILAIPFYQLFAAQFPGARITVAVNHPGLLLGNQHVTVDNERTEFDCDRFIFLRDDAKNRPRLEHLCELHGIPFREIEPAIDVGTVPLPTDFPAGAKAVIAYSCGAGWACKACPVATMKEILPGLRARFPEARFVEVGRDCATVGEGISFIDRLSVAETAAVLARCKLYVGPDSGLAHLALAVGITAAILYGPVDPARAFGPRQQLIAFRTPESCGGCWTDGRMTQPGVCPRGFCGDQPDAYACMTAFQSGTVCDEIARRLSAGVTT